MLFQRSGRDGIEAYAKRSLGNHGVSILRGFLGHEDPLVDLPLPHREIFAQHLALGKEMPDLLLLGGDAYKRRVLSLPTVERAFVHSLQDDALLRLAVTMSFLVQAYIWQDRHHPRTSIPAALAVPMYAIGRALNVAPLLIYQFYTLRNWKRRDADGPIAIENVRMIQNFNSSEMKERHASEEWFVAVHVEIEAVASRALQAALLLDAALGRDDIDLVGECLCRMTYTLSMMEKILARMNEGCDPETYYHHVRPYLFGWFNVPGGVIYEGVPELFGGGQLWRGQTGAQSSIAPLLDVLLCIPHEDPKLSEHLQIMLRYHTPQDHRELVFKLMHSFAVRRERWTALLYANGKMSELYKKTRRALADFRRQHYDHALTYIAKPARRESEAQASSGEAVIPGTGGSDLIRSLKLHIAETLCTDDRTSVMSQYEEHWKELYHSS